jgi:signal transduction histidine kinase/ActR/RegA family two-component response regulator
MQPSFDFLSDGGEMGALMRKRDWAATLGPPALWPQTLKTSLRLVLTSNHPMFIWWGPELIQFYNDAYRQTMGPERHPGALGQRGRECWAEIWHIVGPQIESVMAGGKATWHEDQLVPVTRHGQREDVWWTYGYSPIQDAEGVRGVLVVCNDVTAQHQSWEKQLRLNRQLVDEIQRREKVEQHLAFQLKLSDELRGLSGPSEIAGVAFDLVGRYLSVSRINYVDIDELAGTFHISHEWKQDELPSVHGQVAALRKLGLEIVATLRGGNIVRVNDTVADARTASHVAAYGAMGARAILIVPLIKDGRLVAAISLQQSSPYGWTAGQVTLLEDMGQRIWNAIEQARAEAQQSLAAQSLAAQNRAESQRLRSMFQQAPGFMVIFQGPDHVFEFCNAAYLRLVGDRDLVGRSVRDALPEIEGQGFFELLDEVFATGQPFSANDVPLLVQRQAAGPPVRAYVDFVYQPIVDSEGTITGIFVEGFDATERRDAKLALETSQLRLKEGMDAARMVIWDWDIAADKIKFSDNAPMVLGSTWTDANAAWASIYRHDLQLHLGTRDKAIAARTAYKQIVRFARPDDGEVMWLQIYGNAMCGENGHPFAVRGVAIDVTERQRAEEALREADRRKDEFLAMLAHELRNPLAPIGSAAQVLSISGHDEKRVRQSSQIIARQVDHMTSLINDMLDVSRVTSGLVNLDKQSLDIKQIVAESIEQTRPLIERRRHRLMVDACAEPVFVLGDGKRLVQIVTNLLQNAAKYTPEGGSIAIQVEQRGDEVVISVSDNGIGIDEQLLPHVFELFTQGKRSSDRSQGGLGLGLALVGSLVSLHGGRVVASSEGSGKGAIFTVAIPRLTGVLEPSSEGEGTSRFSQPAGRSLQVLVVDDNVDAASSMAMFLEAAGHVPLVEHDSIVALESARQQKPEVILLDIGLSGIDGNELARQLRSMPQTAGATLIAVTGYGQDHDRQRSIAAGFDYFFVKPVNSQKLMELLADIAQRTS